jgi:hypothetical protein
MFYRSNSRVLLAALIAAMLGACAPTRAEDRTSDLEAKLKKKEAEYKELEQQLQSQQAAQPFQTGPETYRTAGSPPKHLSDQASEFADQVRRQVEDRKADFFFGQAPMRTRVEAAPVEAIRAAAAEVRDAKEGDDRKAAQKKLDEALSKYFDDDMAQREKDLKQVEERVTKLRDLLERRRASKQEIIDLEAKVALNQANGLGFYDGDAAGGPGGHPLFGHGGSSSISGSGGGFSSQYIAPRVKAVPPVPPVKPSRSSESSPPVKE